MERRDFMRGAGASLAGLAVAPSTAQAIAEAQSDDYEPPSRTVPESPDDVSHVEAAEGVVTSSNPAATQAGIEVLENGGNAVDAAAAVQLALAVVEPHSTGLGGGGYMSVYAADEGTYYGINKNVRAIAGAEPDMPVDLDNGLAAGVPGIVRGLDYALKRWGTTYFDEVAQPAIELARDGWTVDAELGRRIHQAHADGTLNEVAQEVYFDDDGEPLRPGDRLVQPDKAWSLEQLAEGGSEAFYQGPVAERVVEHLRELGANYELDDYARYNVTVDHPIWAEYDGYDVAVFPEDGGISVAETIELWDRLDADALDPGSPEQLHYHTQAVRAGTADYGAYATDPEYVDLPHGGLWSGAYLDDRFASGVDVETSTDPGAGDPWAYQPGDPYRTKGHMEAMPRGPLVDGRTDGLTKQTAGTATSQTALDPGAMQAIDQVLGTNHYAVADSAGNLVLSMTTLGVGWYGGIMPEGTGFMLSVLQAYFGGPGSVNEARPHKRPALPGSHVVAFDDGDPVLAIGTPQGPPAIKSTLPRTVVNVLTHDMDLAEATYEPRVAGLYAHGLDVEPGIDDETIAALEARGHEIPRDEDGEVETVVRGSMQSIRRRQRGRSGKSAWEAAADSRREGQADGIDEGNWGGPPGDDPGQGPPNDVPPGRGN